MTWLNAYKQDETPNPTISHHIVNDSGSDQTHETKSKRSAVNSLVVFYFRITFQYIIVRVVN